MSRQWVIMVGLGCLVVALFAPVRGYQFINYDDPQYVGNPTVQKGLTIEGAGWAFTTFAVSNYHPLTWLSHMLDATLFGDDPAGPHLMSVAIHALNAVLLYWLLRTATGGQWESVAVAALWCVHPLRVESVAWVAERKDVLSTFFFLLALACYTRYARRRSWGTYGASLVCFVLALLSKPMAVTLPFVMLLLDLWPLKREAGWKKLVLEKAPFFVLTIIFATLTILAQHQGGAMAAGKTLSMPLRLGNAFASLWSYLRLTAWPTNLAIFYPYYGALDNTHLSARQVVLGVICLLAGSAVAAMSWRRERAVMIGWLWFLGMLAPVIGLVPMGRQSMADRYTYLPQMGLLMAVVWGVASLCGAYGKAAMRGAAVVTAALVIALALRTRHQLAYWHDSGTLFSHAMEVTDHNPVAHANLAAYRLDQGDQRGALRLFIEAMEIVPREPGPYYYAARISSDLGQHEDAIRYGRIAAGLDPGNFMTQYDLAVELAEHGDIEEALGHFELVVKLSPNSPEAQYAFGLALKQSGQAQRAHRALDRAAELARAAGKQALLQEIKAAKKGSTTRAASTTRIGPKIR